MDRTHAGLAALRVAALPLIVATLLAAGCGRSSGPGADGRTNLILVTLDTTRADRIGCYGYADAATPNLDALAREGALFENAVAVGPVTLPSHVSLLTGRYPPAHGVRMNGDSRLRSDATLLAEHLAGQGYDTAAVVGAYVLSSDFGIGRGFGSYDEPREPRAVTVTGDQIRHQPIVERPAGEVTDVALGLLDGKLTEPFFLWVHYFDPHAEYSPPEPFADRFSGSPYDGEIAYVDAQVGRLFDALKKRGRFDRTLIAVTADHGESLGEHGENTHGLFVYDATVAVPLLMRLPGEIPAGTRSDRVVSGVDVAPTLLELAGLPPMEGVDGVSFAAVARGGNMPPRDAVYAEAYLPLRAYGWSPLHALRDAGNKFIEAPIPELYDLSSDPGETNNLAPSDRDRLRPWRQRLDGLRSGWPEEAASGSVQPLSEEDRARLAALGYLSAGPASDDGRDRPDPKRLVGVHNLLIDVQVLVARGALPQTGPLLERALELDPTNPAALELNGTLLCTTGNCDRGIEMLQLAVELSPETYQSRRNLGNALHLSGRLAEAAEAYRAAIALQPFVAEDHYALGNVFHALGDLDGAVRSYREAVRFGLDTAPVHAALGQTLTASGDFDAARASLQAAIDRDASSTDAWNRLGILTEKEGNLEQARGYYEKAIETRPDGGDALFNYAKVCLRLADVPAAEDGIDRLIETDPDYPAGRFLEAQIRLAAGDRAAGREALEAFLSRPQADPRLIEPARDLLKRLQDTP